MSEHIIPKSKYVRQQKDPRDRVFKNSAPKKNMPRSHRINMGSYVYAQGASDCTSNACAAIIRQALKSKHNKEFFPSRLYIYFFGRRMFYQKDDDSGSWRERDDGLCIRDALKATDKFNAASEEGPHGWPYDMSKFSTPPPKEVRRAARALNGIVYESVPQDASLIKEALLQGLPIVGGFLLTHDFFEVVRDNGGVWLPTKETIAQGAWHAMCIVGYDDTPKIPIFILMNSWGPDFGAKGYATMPQGWALDNTTASDFWIVKDVFKERGISNK